LGEQIEKRFPKDFRKGDEKINCRGLRKKRLNEREEGKTN